MSKRTCTEARRCERMNCYDCRRYLIDQTALAMLDSGIPQDQVDQYRYGAINALAFEIPTKPSKPEAKLRKAFTPKVGIDYQGMADKLRVCGSRSYAFQLLMGRTVAELHHIASLAGTKLTGRLKAELLNSLVENTVGFRLDHNAVMNGAKA